MFSNTDPEHAVTHPLSQRLDKPHIWMYAGWYRVSAWNRRRQDLTFWHKAQVQAGRLNELLRQERAAQRRPHWVCSI